MDFLFWILFGLIVGTVANFIDPKPSSGGWIGSIILGVVGAVVGGFIGNSLFGVGVSGYNISSFLVAIAGALLVMFIARMVRRA